jgi:nitrite reductase (NADH) small subunit/3-phenylpropionate/trans-cinnamate dioxygenase ferredoxin subunit
MIAVFCLGEDEYQAIDDFCPHMGASLAEGYLEAGVVSCPWHAWRFRVCDGTWCDNPKIKIDAFPVRVRDGQIEVGVAAEA